jgi:serine/threonine protein kinase
VAHRIGDETILEQGTHAGRDLLIGTTVDSYRIESIVGSGAMGIVYRGCHTVISKVVAIKVLKADFADDPDMVQRLVREARTVNAIHHPSIVDAFGFGTLPRTGQPYIVMDLLVGEPLDAYVEREAPVTLKEAAVILDELLSALAAAHRVGVIHRDLKPGNCFLETQPDGGRRLKLLDFGLARQADRAGGSIRPTNPGSLIGTPAFMAPEQVMGLKITPATDLYAVGGMAYQLLTRHLPHEATSAIEVLTQKMKADPVRAKIWNPALDDETDEWVMALLERDPDTRIRDADLVRRQLRRLTERRTTASRPVFSQATPTPIRLKPGADPMKAERRAPRIEVPQSTTESNLSPWSLPPGEQAVSDETLLSSKREQPLGDAPLPPSGRAKALGDAPLPPSGRAKALGDAPLPPSGRAKALGDAPLPPSGRAKALGEAPLPPSGRAKALGDAPRPPSGRTPAVADPPPAARSNPQPAVFNNPLSAAEVSTLPPSRAGLVPAPTPGFPTWVGGHAATPAPDPQLTPPSPTFVDYRAPVPPITLPPAEASSEAPVELPQAHRGLIIALGVTVLVLFVGLVWLVKLVLAAP